MSVYAPMLGITWQALEAHGYDPAEYIEEEYYRPDRWPPDPERIRFREYDAVTARAIALLDDPTLGLQAGVYLHPSHLGTVGGAWLASSTLREAILLTARYTSTYHGSIELHVEELEDRVRAVYRLPRLPTYPDIIGDSCPASLFRLCKFNLGRKLVPVEVTLTRPQPEDPIPWYAFFGVEVTFGHAYNTISISLEDADKPLTGGNPDLVALHEEIMQQHMLKLDRDDIIYRTRLNIMELLPYGRVTAVALAQRMNMSTRTLHRKLRENGESVRSLLADVRKDLARRYIRGSRHSITDITFLLGYADTSAFSRAFRDWFGLSPTQARETR